ncbi:MAG: response regulator [Deltaproteobacteria bacterium]|nr:response regulator [Deltaproteobacteria bacterium]
MGERPRVLVIDDEEVVRSGVARTLSREGMATRLCAEAREALAALEETPFDVIITDLMMPGMDGMALLRELAARGSTTPAVMVTGYATVRTAVEALKLGAFDYLAKPFTRRELSGVIHRALTRGEHEPPSGRTGAEEGPGSGGLSGVPPGTLFILKEHSWARLEQDGQMTVGVEPVFARAAAPCHSIVLPAVGDVVEQGHASARLAAADSRIHVVWAPVTGRVTSINAALQLDPDLLGRDPLGDGWLFTLIPLDLLEEAASLSVIRPR